MAVKKKSKVSAEFNMSSLTDIIFLLLIFFMLTSSLVTPNALNLQLPGNKKTNTPPSKSETYTVRIEANGTFYFNNKKVNLRGIESQFKKLKQKFGKEAAVTINTSGRSSNVKVVEILDAAYRYGINPVLLEPR